jgi:DNA-binding transcriptional LysR family regulator
MAAVQGNLQELDGAMSRIEQPTKRTGDLLSVGAPPFVMATVLPPAIQEFRSRRPELQFQLFDGDSATVMQKVQAGALDIGVGVFFKHLTGVRRVSLFRFSLMTIRADDAKQSHRPTMPWSALTGEQLIRLPREIPLQQLIDSHLAKARVTYQASLTVNYLNTQVALVEAGQGVAIIPSYGLPACRSQDVVKSQLIKPIVPLDFSQIRRGGRRLPALAEEFISFLPGYIARWAGRAGIV